MDDLTYLLTAHVVAAERVQAEAQPLEWLAILEGLSREIDDARHASPVESPITSVNRHEPVQDEWGLFDPGRCGIAAVHARLDAMAKTGRAK